MFRKRIDSAWFVLIGACFMSGCLVWMALVGTHDGRLSGAETLPLVVGIVGMLVCIAIGAWLAEKRQRETRRKH